MEKCLITRPNHDKVTSYLFAYSKKIMEEIYPSKIQFLDLAEGDANTKNVESYLEKQNPKIVLFNGHGSSTQIFGFKEEVLIEKDKNEELLNEKIVYSLSCDSARTLGKSAIEKGAKAFIGYKNAFILGTEETRESTPLKDNIASSFLKPSNRLSISLLKGNSAKEASRKSKEEFKREMRKYTSTEAIPGTDKIFSALLWNMSNQVVLGNENSSL